MAGSCICIDLKSFYAAVECVDRGLDPLTTNLVVADESRTSKTICLAVSPSLKALGIPGRARLFDVKQKLREIRAMTGKDIPLIIAPPRMARYMEMSADIYAVYLQYIAPEDIHVYSVDEVFIDAKAYLKLYGMDAAELAMTMVREVYARTGTIATAGIGTNLYLAKVAMDIVAKRSPPDKDGVRLAELDEESYKAQLWDHRPLTDFWQVGSGISKRLAGKEIYTMGDIARCSLGKATDFYNEDLLYGLFGVNAELLIDHAWGIEPCTMEDIKRYRPASNSVGAGQVLPRPYAYEEARIIVREMVERLVLDLLDKGLLTDAIVLHVGYEKAGADYRGEVKTDYYGRRIPRAAHGTANLGTHTASRRLILEAVMDLFERQVNADLFIRRVYITAIRVLPEEAVTSQLDLFSDQEQAERETQLQRTILGLQKRYGKSAVLKGEDYLDCATARLRSQQIGGHRA